MPQPAMRSDLNEAFDVEGHLFAQIAFNRAGGVDRFGDLAHFLLGEILDPDVRIDLHLGEDLAGPMWANAINVL